MIRLAPSKSPKRPRQDRILPYRAMESISLNHILLPDNLSNFQFGSRSTPHLGCLSERIQSFGNRCFSSDGSLFAAYSFRDIDIWKYTSGRLRYTPRRVFQPQSTGPIHLSPLLFSPTLSSILGHPTGALEVWRLDGLPIVARPDTHTSVAVPSRWALKSATSHRLDSTIAISHLLSQTPSQFIDTAVEIRMFALTDNVLLVLNSDKLVA